MRRRLVVALAGLAILVTASWLALIVVTRIDELFLPGQEINVGGLAKLPGVQQDTTGPDKRVNILVMGLDRRPEEGDSPTRSDTMFVLTIDPQSKTAGILGMPRDLLVEIPNLNGEGYYRDRINSVYMKGEKRGYPGGGTALVRQVLERNFSITIDHHVIIDFEGFVELIDALDGIDVYVPEAVRDSQFLPKERPEVSVVAFEVGLQHMNGRTALDYARIRYGSDDLKRVQRQQRVIFAAIAKATELNLVDVGKLTDLWRNYKDTIDTDINDLRMPGFAALAAQIDPNSITALSLGAAARPWTTPGGAAVLLFDKELAQQIIQALFNDQRLLEDNASVEVQNGAGADGLADRAVDYLASFGFPAESLTVSDAGDGPVRPLTEIIDFSGKEYSVERLASLLTVPAERVRAAEPGDSALRTSNADILIILGADAQTGPFASEVSGG